MQIYSRAISFCFFSFFWEIWETEKEENGEMRQRLPKTSQSYLLEVLRSVRNSLMNDTHHTCT